MKTIKNKNKDNLRLSPEAVMMSRKLGECLTAIRQAIVTNRRGSANHRLACRTMTSMVTGGYQVDRLAFLTLRHLFNVTPSEALQTTFIKLGQDQRRGGVHS